MKICHGEDSKQVLVRTKEVAVLTPPLPQMKMDKQRRQIIGETQLKGTVSKSLTSKSAKWSERNVKDFGLCEVCNGRSSGVHYGVPTCEGCKGFFRRECTSAEFTSRCRTPGQCSLSRVTNRTCCQRCRMIKCMLVGMDPRHIKLGSCPTEGPKPVEPRCFDINDEGILERFRVQCGKIFNEKKMRKANNLKSSTVENRPKSSEHPQRPQAMIQKLPAVPQLVQLMPASPKYQPTVSANQNQHQLQIPTQNEKNLLHPVLEREPEILLPRLSTELQYPEQDMKLQDFVAHYQTPAEILLPQPLHQQMYSRVSMESRREMSFQDQKMLQQLEPLVTLFYDSRDEGSMPIKKRASLRQPNLV